MMRYPTSYAELLATLRVRLDACPYPEWASTPENQRHRAVLELAEREQQGLRQSPRNFENLYRNSLMLSALIPAVWDDAAALNRALTMRERAAKPRGASRKRELCLKRFAILKAENSAMPDSRIIDLLAKEFGKTPKTIRAWLAKK